MRLKTQSLKIYDEEPKRRSLLFETDLDDDHQRSKSRSPAPDQGQDQCKIVDEIVKIEPKTEQVDPGKQLDVQLEKEDDSEWEYEYEDEIEEEKGQGQGQGQSQEAENVTKVDVEPVKTDQIDQEITQNQTSHDQEYWLPIHPSNHP